VISTALKEGINYIDTAPWYKNSEEILGKILPHISRSKYVLSSKCGRFHSEDVLEWFDFSYNKVYMSIEASIQKLGCKYLDICYLHDIEFAPNNEILVTEALPAMAKAKQEGKIKYIGISGYPLDKIQKLIELSDVKVDVVLTYCRYNLHDTTLLQYLPWFEEQGIGVVNASPFAMGLLTDQGPPCWHSAREDTKSAAKEAAVYCASQSTSLMRLALHYTLSEEKLPVTLVGCENLQQLKYNLDVLKKGISQSEGTLINTIKDEYFAGAEHHWEGIGETKYWHKVKSEMNKACNVYWKMQGATAGMTSADSQSTLS